MNLFTIKNWNNSKLLIIHMQEKQLYRTGFIFLFIACILFFLSDIFFGQVLIPVHEVLLALFNRLPHANANYIIITQSRLPEALTSVLVGAALPVAGLCMQTFFKNPVAGPDILGITSGASLFVAIIMMGLGNFLSYAVFGSITIIVAAIAGSIAVLFFMLMAAKRIHDSITLLIFGLMFGTAVSALVGIIQYFSEKGALKLFILWSFGSLSGVTWNQLYILIPITSIALFFCFLLSKKLNLLLLGEQYARTLGLHVKKTRFQIILITGILTGTVTAFCGPIAFVGIAVPHIVRMLFKTNNHFILIPACILCGITVMLFCDIISKMPGSNFILPVNSITALLGAPFVIFIVIKNQQLKRYF